MKSMNFKFLAVFLVLASFLYGCLKTDEATPIDENGAILSAESAQRIKTPISDEGKIITYSSQAIPNQYIVVFKENALDNREAEAIGYEARQNFMKTEVQAILAADRIPAERVQHVYGHAIKGFAATLTTEEVAILSKSDKVAYIEQDQVMSINMGGPGGGGGGGGSTSQVTPYGITRVNGGVSGAAGTGWIIDSGIDLDHPDLNVDVARSMSFLSGGGGNTSADDYNGHGTHVAGTVAAIDNSQGVIGVAAGASVVAVRVLDRRGSGSTSGVIAGVNYVAANAANGDAANMSLGGGVSSALDNAVLAASSACPFALAAGNESSPANNSSPARVNGNNIYTVSSMTSSNSWSSFSNYGNPPVDYCAPGSSVYSTYKDGGYATLSGTSMATPHVCGILLLGNISTDGVVSGDPDGTPDPIAVH